MAADENPTAQPPQGPALAIDDEIEHGLWDHADDPEAYQQIVSSLTEADEPRALWGIGRALVRLEAEITALLVEREMVTHEINDAIGKRSIRVRWLASSIKASVLARREAGLGNFLDLPGVGRWSSQKTQPGWDLPTRKDDVEAIKEWLRLHSPDSYPEIVQDVPTLNTTELRDFLDAVHAENENVLLPPGVTYREADVSVSGPGL